MAIQELIAGGGLWVPYFGGTQGEIIIPVPPDGNRDGLDNLWGTFEPSYATTGLYDGYSYNTTSGATNLPFVHAGDWFITEAVAASLPSRTLQGYKVDGRLVIQAPNVTVKNCWIRGLATPANGLVAGDDQYLIDCSDSKCVNFTVKDSVLVPNKGTFGWNAIGPRNYTAIRIYTKWTVDSFRCFPAFNSSTLIRPQSGPVNIKIYGTFAEELAYFSPDPNHSNDNRTHNDIMQLEGGSGIEIIGNKWIGRMAGWNSQYSIGIPGSIGAGPSGLWPTAVYGKSGTDEGSVAWNLFAPGNLQPPSIAGGYGRFGWTPSTSLLQITQNVGQVSGMLVDRNWFYSGATQLNASNIGAYPPPATKTTNLGTWSNNRFDQTGGQPNNNIAYGVNFTLTTFGNVRMDNGAAANVKTQTT